MLNHRILGEGVEHRLQIPNVESEIEPVDQINHLAPVGGVDRPDYVNAMRDCHNEFSWNG
jgi:hypothetical protein